MIKKNSYLTFFICLILITHSTFSQNSILKGLVTDSILNPLPHANILAFPDSEDLEPVFAVTDEKGNYLIKLKSKVSYQFQISYLGYKKISTQITISENTLKNFILKETINALDEVEVTYKIPIQIKEDTITYNADAFTSGKERKLREILKKLPGLEVDRDGNVTSNGKEITKVLVDNKPFFTGNSKLAVNNIPANVVDQIIILDNYNEVAILKGLQDTDEMAMNIKLKKDKKKFLFGDLELGGGYEKRYTAHPNIFYYSPKTNINFIGDLNNTGNKAFTLTDYLEFEGGFGRLLNNSGSYFNLFTDDFAQFLNETNFKENIQKFGALNIRQTINNEIDISGYVISSYSNTDTEIVTQNIYQNNTFSLIENRINNANLNNFFTTGKITVDYEPSYNEDFAYNSFIKLTQNKSEGLISTLSNGLNNNISTISRINTINVKQNLSYSKKFNDKHTGTLEVNYEYLQNKPKTEWNTDSQILVGLIPLTESDDFSILQTKQAKANIFNSIVKDYWSLNSFNHLYFSFGIYGTFNSFENEDVQQLENGSLNNFSSNGFGNDLKYNFLDTYIGLEYKFKIGSFIFKPALYQHFYNWSINQENIKKNKIKTLILPEFNSEVSFENNAKLQLKYKINARFASINYLADNFILTNFNSVFKGDQNLENELYHTAWVRYSKHSLLRGFRINTSVNYKKKAKSFKRDTRLQGIDQFSTPILFDLPENRWVFSSSFSKKVKKINTRLQANYSLSDFYQIINSNTSRNKSNQVNGSISLETLFKKGPNIQINYTKKINDYSSILGKNRFSADDILANIDYVFLKDFTFQGEYNYSTYSNIQSNINNTFDNARLSLFYQKEESPWGFEVEVTNLFDTKFKQDNSFGSFIISDRRTFILPRIILLKAIYKL